MVSEEVIVCLANGFNPKGFKGMPARAGLSYCESLAGAFMMPTISTLIITVSSAWQFRNSRLL